MPAVDGRRSRVSRGRSTVLRSEPFLTSTNIVANTLTLGVNRPSKQGDVWSALSIPNTGAYADWGVGWISSHQVNTVTRLFYTGFESTSITYVHGCYATTTDGTTITRPSLGLRTFNGSTANNVITPSTFTRNQQRVVWDELTQQYVCFVYWHDGVSTYNIDLFAAADPMASGWGSYVKRITAPLGVGLGNAQACEPMALVRRSDNRWFMYIQTSEYPTADYGSSRRHIGALLGPSDGSLTGTWTSIGALADNAIKRSPSGDSQYYHVGAWVDGEHVYVPAGIYDGSAAPPADGSFSGTVNRIHKVDLMVAPASDPSSLTSVDSSWFSSTGVYGDYDGGEVCSSNNVARAGNTWRYFFGGDGNTHHQSPENIRHMGYATLGYRRIGKASGSGSVTLSTISAPVGGRVIVNGTNITNVELLDGSSSVLSGYGTADAVPADAYDHTVSWAGRSGVPTSFRVRVTVSSGAVNHVEVRS